MIAQAQTIGGFTLGCRQAELELLEPVRHCADHAAIVKGRGRMAVRQPVEARSKVGDRARDRPSAHVVGLALVTLAARNGWRRWRCRFGWRRRGTGSRRGLGLGLDRGGEDER